MPRTLYYVAEKRRAFRGALPELAKTTNGISWVVRRRYFHWRGNHGMVVSEPGREGLLSMGLKMCVDFSIFYFVWFDEFFFLQPPPFGFVFA